MVKNSSSLGRDRAFSSSFTFLQVETSWWSSCFFFLLLEDGSRSLPFSLSCLSVALDVSPSGGGTEACASSFPLPPPLFDPYGCMTCLLSAPLFSSSPPFFLSPDEAMLATGARTMLLLPSLGRMHAPDSLRSLFSYCMKASRLLPLRSSLLPR